MEVVFLGDPNPLGIFNSKAIGRNLPLMYGIGVYFAIQTH
jgi:hypothetical protein